MSKQLRGTELKRFLRQCRRERPAAPGIVFVLQSVEYPVNVGSAFRIADACGVEEVILTGITPTPPNPTIAKVARGKQDRVPWRYVKETSQLLGELRSDGYRVCALEITEEAIPYYSYAPPEKLCLVVGHEDHGITKATLAQCDDTVFIPMYGKGLSLNVHVALAVVTYHLLHGRADG